MADLPYLGTDPAAASDLAPRSYLDGLAGQNMTQTQVDSLIASAYQNYVTKSYVDAQDAKNATTADIDAGDATRIKLSTVNQNSGAAGLDSAGRIQPSRIAAPSTQRYPKAFYSPSAYHSTVTATSGSTEVQLYTHTVADPGYANYKLLVTGLQDVYSNTDGEFAVIRVRVGSMTGQVIAGAYTLGETYIGGVLTQFTTPGANVYSVPPFASSVDVVALGGGGGGQDGFIFFGVSFYGRGANGGQFATGTITTPPSTLTATVGAGGERQAVGGSTTVTGTGVTTITALGGNNGGNGTGDATPGHSPGQIVYNGNTYVGGPESIVGTVPTTPGTGGPGGTPPGSGPGLKGAPGAVWFLAQPSVSVPSWGAPIAPTPINAQTALSGTVTLYVTIQRSGSASIQSATTVNPKLFVVPFPA